MKRHLHSRITEGEIYGAPVPGGWPNRGPFRVVSEALRKLFGSRVAGPGVGEERHVEGGSGPDSSDQSPRQEERRVTAQEEQSSRRRYLIAEATPVLVTVAQTCHDDPEINLVDVRGPQDDPTVLLIETSEKRATQLAQEFTNVILEVDAELGF